MTANKNDSFVDRMVFRHTGQRDFQATGTSMNSAETRQRVSQLRLNVRVAHPNRPASSLLYVRAGMSAAVLCRLSSPHGGGSQDVCHALVGHYSQLGPELALQLCDWNQWRHKDWESAELPPEKPNLSPWPLSRIQQNLTPPKKLAKAADQQRNELTAIVMKILSPPAEPISIVAKESPPLQRAGLLWGLLAMTEALSELTDQQPFTFSTFEERSDLGAEHLPFAIFVPPNLPKDSPFGQRKEVEIPAQAEAPPDLEEYFKEASELVASYIYDTSPGVIGWFTSSPASKSGPIEDRAGLSVADAKRQPSPATAAMGLAELTVPIEPNTAETTTQQNDKQPSEADDQLSQDDKQHSGDDEQELQNGRQSPEATTNLPLLLRARQAIHDWHHRKSRLTPEDRHIRELLGQLRSKEPDTVRSTLEEIKQLGERPKSDKKYVHRMLLDRRFFENELCAVLPPEETPGAVAILVRFGVATDDFRDRLLFRRLNEMSEVVNAPRLATVELRTHAFGKVQDDAWLKQPTRMRAQLGALLKRSAVRADYWQEMRRNGAEPPIRRNLRYGIVLAFIIALVSWLVIDRLIPSLFADAPPTATSEVPLNSASLDQLIKGVGQFQVTSVQFSVAGTSNWKPEQTTPLILDSPFQWRASATATTFVDFANLPPLTPDSLDTTNHIARLPNPEARPPKIEVDESSFVFTDQGGNVTWIPKGDDLQRLLQEAEAQAALDRAGLTLTDSVEKNARDWLTALLKANGFTEVVFF